MFRLNDEQVQQGGILGFPPEGNGCCRATTEIGNNKTKSRKNPIYLF
jgi:hypothetical protein